MILPTLASVLALFCIWESTHAAPQSQGQRNSGDYSVTHLDIRDAILSLVSVLRDQMDKLERHEVRERQLGEQLTRSLASLEKRGRGEEKNIENIASYIARIEEKVKFLQSTVETQSEDRKLEHEKTGEEVKAIRQAISSGTQNDALSVNLEKKIDTLSEKINLLREAGETNAQKFDGLMEVWKATTSTSGGGGGDVSDAVMQELEEIKEALARTAEIENQLLSTKLSSQGQNDWQVEMIESMDSQRKQLSLLEEEIGKALGLLGDMTKSASGLKGALTQLESDTKKGFQAIDSQVEGLRVNSTGGGMGGDGADINEKLGKVQDILKSGQNHLEEKVRAAEAAVETMFVKMEDGYQNLKSELKGLANVESVLLDTGDSVLDTKRRLEYGVQQIMGEINNQLSQHTASLNASLQQRFDGLANAVLGNQSVALTNLTSRMEEEISQVWRQIGILYHQMSRSATLLDEIHSQTSKYVNNSLDTMSSMDGKVGQITNQMGEVDENLNYLLGRMSLVVQEFNMIKGGIGDALNNVKDSFSEISQKPNPLETNVAEE